MGGSSDIEETSQTDLLDWGEAMIALDRKSGQLEYGMCAGWRKVTGPMSVEFVDTDGYKMTLRLIDEAEVNRRRDEFIRLYKM